MVTFSLWSYTRERICWDSTSHTTPHLTGSKQKTFLNYSPCATYSIMCIHSNAAILVYLFVQWMRMGLQQSLGSFKCWTESWPAMEWTSLRRGTIGERRWGEGEEEGGEEGEGGEDRI